MTPTPRSRLGKRSLGVSWEFPARATAGAALLLSLTSILAVSGARTAGEPGTAPTTAPTTAPPAATAADLAAAEDIARVRGVVLDPVGKPVAGARVVVVDNRPDPNRPPPEPIAEVRTEAGGQFELSFPKPTTRPAAGAVNLAGVPIPVSAVINLVPGSADAGPQVAVVASADGYGAAWGRWDGGLQLGPSRPGEKRAGDLSLRLVLDHPIEGRILDLEGRPVAGVNVKPYAVMAYLAYDPAFANRAQRDDRDIALYHPSASTAAAPATTGPDGRFRIAGLGADRTVILHFDSAKVALTPAYVVTRNDAPPARVIYAAGRVFAGQQFFTGRPDLFAAPARVVVGTVRDAGTHRPLAGVKVLANPVPGSRREAVTDAQGQFRLEGIPKGQVRFQVAPPADQPYFAHDRVVPDQPGIGALRVDIDLHRGVWITGRVTDKGTGEPVPAFVQYAPFLSNKRAAIPEYQAMQGVRFPQGPQGSGTTAADGSYRVVGLPGAGVVAVVTEDDLYPKGQGADQIKESQPAAPDPASVAGRVSFGTYQPWMGPDRVTAVRPVELGADEAAEGRATHVDFRVDPGSAIEVTLSGPSGSPVGGAWVIGDHADGALLRVQGTTFKAVEFGDDERRLLVLRDVAGSLGKVVAVRLADAPRRRLRVRLEPAGVVTGRLVDADGKPVGSASVQAETAVDGMGDRQRRVATAQTQADGRFQIDLFGGCDYSLTAETGAPGSGTVKPHVERFAIQPGEKKDLGDIRVGNPPEATPTR